MKTSSVDPLFRLSAYDYTLPPERVAQQPVEPRDAARMMIVRMAAQSIEHTRFYELPRFLNAGDVIVVNNTRVIPARLHGWRDPNRRQPCEALLIRPVSPPRDWLAMVRPGRRIRVGSRLYFPNQVTADVIAHRGPGLRLLRFPAEIQMLEYLHTHGHMPIPPYIRSGRDRPEDREWYQTTYARIEGSIAAPTAGLHMTERVQHALREKKIAWVELTLHVGPGTFKPVTTPDIRQHRIDPEAYEIPRHSWHIIETARREGRRIIAVGTTTTRALEYAVRFDPPRLKGWTDLFIYPGFKFRIISGLITNFHLPRSSLLMLVCAFGGYDLIMSAYQEAIRREYRFYSYGDGMLILP